MKAFLFSLLIPFALHAYAEEPATTEKVLGIGDHRMGRFKDPRWTISFYQLIEDGKEVEDVRIIGNSILIICWMPETRYQISGIDGFFSREHVERFLSSFYNLQNPKESTQPINVIVAGNNWGSGLELKPKLIELSKKRKFDVFYAGGWAFQEVDLIEEPAARLKLIQAAQENAISEQVAAPNP